MQFDLTTCVWGPWHLDIMGQIMLPTLLAPGNLPALVAQYDVRYRISTTHTGKARIQALPVFKKLAAAAMVDIVVGTDAEQPAPIHHVNWYHKAVQDARERGALCAFVPPDVAWANGTFDHMGAVMAAGKLGTAMPYLRVISETCSSEMAVMAKSMNGTLSIPPGELVRLGLRHLHPLTAAAMAHGRHGRPSLEMLWRVPGEGLLLRHMVRELFSFDPQHVTLTHLWYAGTGCTGNDIHIVRDSDEMIMLSFAPLLKDIPIYIPDHSVDAIDLARSSLHPWNDSPLNGEFPRHHIRLHHGPVTESRWRRVERCSDVEFKKAMVMRDVMRVWSAIKDEDCSRAARLISLALQCTPLARRWPVDAPVSAFVPLDTGLPEIPSALIRDIGAATLMKWILNHVVAGTAQFTAGQSLTMLGGKVHRIVEDSGGTFINSSRIVRCLDVAPHRVYLVDKPLVLS
jgi:hypothetical protein